MEVLVTVLAVVGGLAVVALCVLVRWLKRDVI